MLESSRHVESVDAGHRGGERRVRGRAHRAGCVACESRAVGCAARRPPRGWSVSCELQGWQSELTFLSSCKRRRQCDDFLCPKVTIFVTQATGLALSRGADTLVRRRSVMIRAEVQTLS